MGQFCLTRYWRLVFGRFICCCRLALVTRCISGKSITFTVTLLPNCMSLSSVFTRLKSFCEFRIVCRQLIVINQMTGMSSQILLFIHIYIPYSRLSVAITFNVRLNGCTINQISRHWGVRSKSKKKLVWINRPEFGTLFGEPHWLLHFWPMTKVCNTTPPHSQVIQPGNHMMGSAKAG